MKVGKMLTRMAAAVAGGSAVASLLAAGLATPASAVSIVAGTFIVCNNANFTVDSWRSSGLVMSTAPGKCTFQHYSPLPGDTGVWEHILFYVHNGSGVPFSGIQFDTNHGMTVTITGTASSPLATYA